MPPRVKFLLIGLLCLAGAVRLVHLHLHLASPLGRMEEELLSTDIHAFSVWGRGIAAGDLLGRETYHPYMDWMEPVAPLATFEAWWGGKAIYHQAPLYAYLLGASYALVGSPYALLLLQALAGTLSVLWVVLLARRFWDDRAGLLAGLFAALFPPAIVLDSILLRASLISSLTLLSVLALLHLRDRPGPGRGLAAGLLLGLGILLKPTGLLLALTAPLLLLWIARPGRLRSWLPALAAGVVLCLAPLVARNLTLGAPAFALSTRGPETMLQANNSWTDPGLFSLPYPISEYGPLMDRAHSSLFAALRTAVSTWPGESDSARLGWWLSHVGRKALCAFQDFEYPNNTNFYFYRRTTPILAWLPSFGWFAGAALVGLFLLARMGRDRAGALIALAGAGMILASILASYAHGRYRMPLAMFLTIPAGATLSFILDRFGRARPWPALAALGIATLLSISSFSLVPQRYTSTPTGLVPLGRSASALIQAAEALRPLEFTRTARLLHLSGRPQQARKLLTEYLTELETFLEAKVSGAEGIGAIIGRSMAARSLRQVGDMYSLIGDAPQAAGLEREAARLQREASDLQQRNAWR